MARKSKKADRNRSVCFVISPIGEPGSPSRLHADMVLISIIQAALPDFDVKRADQFAAPDMITDKVIEAIFKSELAIADLTGLNPNVFYELGLRHMAQKPVIHIANTGTKLPFDTAGVGTIFFDVADIHSHETTRATIAGAAKKVLARGYKISTPVSQARGSAKLATSTDTTDQLVVTLSRRMATLEDQVRHQSETLWGPSTDHLRSAYEYDTAPLAPGTTFTSGPSGPTGPILTPNLNRAPFAAHIETSPRAPKTRKPNRRS